MLPNFLIIGAAKAGTTTLYDIFKTHPNIFVSAKKELNFFSIGIKSKSIDEYAKNFDKSAGFSAVGEASPSYFYTPGTAENIKQYLPDVKLIAVLRNPIERFYSDFKYCQLFGHNLEGLPDSFYDLTVKDVIEFESNQWFNPLILLKKGLYHYHLCNFYDKFPKSNIKILLFEKMIKEFEKTMNDIQGFLGVKMLKISNIQKNSGGVPRSGLLLNLVNKKFPVKTKLAGMIGFQRAGELKEKLLRANIKKQKSKSQKNKVLNEFLTSFYAEDIQKLSNLFKQDFINWKF